MLNLILIIVLLTGFLLWLYIKNKHTFEKLDKMLDSAIDGTFTENTYDETKLSRTEAKIYRYLSTGQTSLRQINNEKNMIKTLIADISHQTKTPIANIMLYTGLLSEDSKLTQEQKDIVTQIENQSEKLNFLISSLVKISRLENGIVKVSSKRHSIDELFNSLDFDKIASDKGVSLKINFSPDLYADFDLKWTSEALGNIIDNAIKYTKSGGKVTVSASDYEMFVRIDVTDNGIGISEDDTARIFGRFYRSKTVSDEKGVGIGLYLAREIISKEGGYIKVASKIGKGSTFSVFLSKL